jgi:S-adenosylmethionine hydrolase
MRVARGLLAMANRLPYGAPMRFPIDRALRLGLNAVALLVIASSTSAVQPGLIVLQTDFGLQDQAVAAMRGVIRSVDRGLIVDDLTHEVPVYDVWEAAFRLDAVIDYWPHDAVFVSVVDPGVGTTRKSVVARLRGGPMIVSPDNGTLTLLADRIGLDAVREIDERRHRLPGSEGSFTFHGRDVYAYVGALLASEQLQFDDVGPLRRDIVRLRYQRARRDGARLIGGVPVLDPRFGNVWTNIPVAELAALGVAPGQRISLSIAEGDTLHAALTVPYVHTFGDVRIGEPLLYVNSVGTLAVALNQGDFAARYAISSGPRWRVVIGPASSG